MFNKKNVAIVQSCYIPWKGYFDLINQVDEFILYDDMQYTRRDWRNRNLIKTAKGLEWLTIPVDVKSKYFQKINETTINDKCWFKKHWKSITLSYSKADYFKQYKAYFEALFAQCENEDYLSWVNYKMLQGICSFLNIQTRLSWSTDYAIEPGLKKTERLLALCQAAGASHYLSGPSARDYMQPELFEKAKITLSYIDYSKYPPYQQLYGTFQHGVTILDLIFNVGPEATQYLRKAKETA